MNRIHYQVTGIVNSEEKTKLKNALVKLGGIQLIAIDVDRRTVEVGYSEKISEPLIRACIENTGYQIMDH